MDTEIKSLLNELDKACFPADSTCHKTGAYWWIAYDSKKSPVGFAGLKIMDKSTAFLCRAGVLEEARGKNLQVRLIRARERKARKLNIKTIITYTCLNVPSINNLIKAGYRSYIPQDPWVGTSMIYWRKVLSADDAGLT